MRHSRFDLFYRKVLTAHHGLLAGILMLALLLRLSGNLYDRGYGFHPDERKYLGHAVEMMSTGALNPGYFRNPPLYTYALLLLLYGLFGLQYALGQVGSRAEFLAALPPPVAFGLARGLAALAGTATCLLLHRLGRRFGGELAGGLAAGFYAVAFLSVRDAHFAVNDTPVVALVILAFLFAVRLLEGGRTRDLVFGGLTAGLAAATKYNGGIALLPLLLACGLAPPGATGVVWGVRLARRGLTLLFFALAGFMLGNPYALLDPPAFLGGLTGEYGLRLMKHPTQSAAPVALLVLRALQVELGWPLLLITPLATVCCLARGGTRARAAVLALSLVFPLLLYHASLALFASRFLLPCTPLFLLICAWGLVAMQESSSAPWVRRGPALVAAVAVLAAIPLARSIYLDVILHRPDTRILTKAYLDHVAPPGSTIVVQKGRSAFLGQGRSYLRSRFYDVPPLGLRDYRFLSLESDPSLLRPREVTADFYLFSTILLGRAEGVLEAEERGLMTTLERLGYARITFSPFTGGEDPLSAYDASFLPTRGLFRYERTGPTIVIYARPGIPVQPSS